MLRTKGGRQQHGAGNQQQNRGTVNQSISHRRHTDIVPADEVREGRDAAIRPFDGPGLEHIADRYEAADQQHEEDDGQKAQPPIDESADRLAERP